MRNKHFYCSGCKRIKRRDSQASDRVKGYWFPCQDCEGSAGVDREYWQFAKTIFAQYKRAGFVTPKECQVCMSGRLAKKNSSGGRPNAHHLDYEHPLKIMWLCQAHHMAWHRLFVTGK